MDEKELKTSPKQRFFIILIAILMLGSIVASYAAIVLNGSQGASIDTDSESSISEEKRLEYEENYNKVAAEFAEATRADFDRFVKYKSEVKAYNETSANEQGVQTKDLEEGTGRILESGDTDYLAYYIGWCADESIFDSSFDDNENPTAFKGILNASLGMIEGWNVGVEGMKIGGIRRITIPGELAYGDSMEICGGYNKPLRFLIMTVANEGSMADLANRMDEALMKYQYAVQYGIDYEELMKAQEVEAASQEEAQAVESE
ncbi:FKBP-type peptidyl-prolyl cis-trans isomerase [Candidatus Saccharibacteria bacterium]|nr:FKBP-type peptidyl-prolyl cis-trans isomerase [Candidatus Saccharibacteria bacterium]